MISGGLSSAEAARRRLPPVRRRRGDDRSRRARLPLGLRGADSEPGAGRPGEEEILAELLWVDRPGRGAPRCGPRLPLPAQVLPLVPGASGAPTQRSPGELQRSARPGSEPVGCSPRSAAEPGLRHEPDRARRGLGCEGLQGGVPRPLDPRPHARRERGRCCCSCTASRPAPSTGGRLLELEAGRAALAFDFLGFGLSDKPTRPRLHPLLAGRPGRGAGRPPRRRPRRSSSAPTTWAPRSQRSCSPAISPASSASRRRAPCCSTAR